jgi:hypothetical protein
MTEASGTEITTPDAESCRSGREAQTTGGSEKKGGGTHILELQEAKLAEVCDGDACALGGDDELHIAHPLRPKVVHRRQPVKHPHPAPSLPPEPPSRSFQKVRGRGENEGAVRWCASQI